MRSARKMWGYSQTQVANAIEVSQPLLSKMEHAQLIPSATQWFRFCTFMKMDPEWTYRNALVDGCMARTSEDGQAHRNRLKKAKEYHQNAATAMRLLRPILVFAEEKNPQILTKNAAFKKNKIDPDCFAVLEDRVNSNFLLNALDTLLNKSNRGFKMAQLVKDAPTEQCQGVLHREYEKLKSSQAVLERFFELRKEYSQANEFKFQKVNNAKSVVTHIPASGPSATSIREQKNGALCCEFTKEYIKSLARYNNLPGVKLKETRCFFQGAPACEYEIEAA